MIRILREASERRSGMKESKASSTTLQRQNKKIQKAVKQEKNEGAIQQGIFDSGVRHGLLQEDKDE